MAQAAVALVAVQVELGPGARGEVLSTLASMRRSSEAAVAAPEEVRGWAQRAPTGEQPSTGWYADSTPARTDVAGGMPISAALARTSQLRASNCSP
jgi:hypothetical protein